MMIDKLKLKLKYLLFFVALMIYISGCFTSKRQTTTSAIADDEGYKVVAIVDYSELSGCGFIFIVNDSVKLIPENLPDRYKQNNTKLKVKFKITNKPNICMAGKTIDVIEVKPVN